MIVSALVVTLDAACEQDVLALLASDPRLTLGEPNGVRVPVVLEAETAEEAERVTEALLRSPGVVFVDVIEVHFPVAGEEASHGAA